MEKQQLNGIYSFGVFRLDVQNRLLWRVDNGDLIPLSLKEFELLLFLVERAGQVIKKDDLLDAVWKDTFVEEGTLTRNVSRLRKKLEPANESGETIIETLPKRGYRFLPAVIETDRNALVVEEQTQIRIRVTEHISTSEKLHAGDAEMLLTGETENKIAVLPQAAATWRNPFRYALLIALASVFLIGAGFIVYKNYFRKPEVKAILVKQIIPFSGALGYENTPAFSPDGKQLAFAWTGRDNGTDFDIYVRLLGAGDSIRLTNSEFNEHYPVFSPDGSKIAFVRDLKTHGEVLIMPALGGEERRVCRTFLGFTSISFSPDGQTLAIIDTEDSKAGKQYAVYLINIQTGERRRLTAPAEFEGETTPRFSPDGKSLAFVRVSGDKKQDLFVVPVTGGAARQLTFDGSTIHSLAWSANGQNIFFVSFRGNNKTNIWRIYASGGDPEMISTNAREITNLALSPDNKTIAYVENARNTDIWRITTNQEPAKKFIASTYNEHDAQFSPDGAHVLFTSDRTGKYEIWLSDIEGKNLRQLTNTTLAVGSPRFSPDGQKVIYNGINRENLGIFIVSVDGGKSERLTSERSKDFMPAWSWDGKWIYFTSNRTGEYQIWRIPAADSDDSKAVQITRRGAYQVEPSPDGKTIFYIKSREVPELWRASVEGDTEQIVQEFVATGFAGRWTMTKSGIYFLAKEPDQFLVIKFYDFATGKIKTIDGNHKIPNELQGNFAATADGKVFLYALQNQNISSIMLAKLD